MTVIFNNFVTEGPLRTFYTAGQVRHIPDWASSVLQMLNESRQTLSSIDQVFPLIT